MFFIESPNYLNEVYFGKTSELQNIEKILNDFRRKYMDKYLTNVHCNNDKDLLKFNRLMEDYFGFGCFTLHIINTLIPDAFTLPIDMRFDIINTNKYLLADKNGFKFNKEADYACIVNISSGIIFNSAYTVEECMAIILHEVGHNFYAALNKNHGILSNLYTVVWTLQQIVDIIKPELIPILNMLKSIKIGNLAKEAISQTNIFQKIIGKLSAQLRYNRNFLILAYDWIETYKCAANTIFGAIAGIADMATLGIVSVLSAFFSITTKIKTPLSSIFLLAVGYSSEKLADNFVTMYGYGPALGTSLNKLESMETKSTSKLIDAYRKIPLISNLYAINTGIGDIILNIFDEHPNTLIRTKDQLDMLEREAQKIDLDPKMKKVILEDCKACRAQIQKLINITDGLSDKDLIKKIYYKFLYENTNSQALKDFIFNNPNKFDIYDRTYAEKFKS